MTELEPSSDSMIKGVPDTTPPMAATRSENFSPVRVSAACSYLSARASAASEASEASGYDRPISTHSLFWAKAWDRENSV